MAILPFKPSIHAFVPGTPMRWWPVLYSDDLQLTPHELDEAGLTCDGDEIGHAERCNRTEAA